MALEIPLIIVSVSDSFMLKDKQIKEKNDGLGQPCSFIYFVKVFLIFQKLFISFEWRSTPL